MINRRNFLGRTLLGGLGLLVTKAHTGCASFPATAPPEAPVLLSTWNHGLRANAKGLDILETGGSALDAVEQGVRVVEGDPKVTTVGYGGMPDRDGHVTLDACIMDHELNCGSVCFLEDIKHPISVARRVMEKTPHVMLAGEGALQFALDQGFPREDLLTEHARKRWEQWKKDENYQPQINIENHDTIGMLALDSRGNLAGACTTSGVAFKLRGRVGDSPVIGAGLYCDGEVGAAVATGLGELVLKTLGAFLIVELMRQGASPQEACQEGIKRISSLKGMENAQIGFLALDPQGRSGAYSLRPGFSYAYTNSKAHQLQKSQSLMG
jgi:N4-(beta-N-acetylglucosaminyl)-L-asparaginase